MLPLVPPSPTRSDIGRRNRREESSYLRARIQNARSSANALAAVGEKGPEWSFTASGEAERQREKDDDSGSSLTDRPEVSAYCAQREPAHHHNTPAEMWPVAARQSIGDKSAQRHHDSFRHEENGRITGALAGVEVANLAEVVIDPIEEDVLEVS